MRFVAAYILLALVIAFAMSRITPWSNYQRLAENGVSAQGTVISTNCSTHQTFAYRFEAGGRAFDGIGQRGVSKECRALVPGDPVKLSYLPSDPWISASGEPNALLENETTSIALAALLLPAVAIAAWVWGQNKRHEVRKA